MLRRTNVFLIINLGCEMLYVIDQRLKAQNIILTKSAQGTVFFRSNLFLIIFFLYVKMCRKFCCRKSSTLFSYFPKTKRIYSALKLLCVCV